MATVTACTLHTRQHAAVLNGHAALEGHAPNQLHVIAYAYVHMLSAGLGTWPLCLRVPSVTHVL
jgi:hypothetical protein